MQENDKMVREFKFFKGFTEKRTFTVEWNNDIVRNFDAEEELTRLMSQEIAREVDNDILNRLFNLVNNGGNQRA